MEHRTRTIGVVVAVFLFLFLVGRYYLGGFTDALEPMPLPQSEVAGGVVDHGATDTDAVQSHEVEVRSVTSGVPQSGFTIEISSLPEAQQSILRTLGYEAQITFTPEMVSCAEGKLGSARVEEIKAGAVPGPVESARLMPCF
jgi:hypothetical protein